MTMVLVHRKKWILLVLPFLMALLLMEMHRNYLPTQPEMLKNDSNHSMNWKIEITTPASVDSTQVDDLAEQCIIAAHLNRVLNSTSIIPQARNNANYFFNEFRRVIPQFSLQDYNSHCWKDIYWTEWSRDQYRGQVGNISFSKNLPPNSPRRLILVPLTRKFRRRKYVSNLTCLPNLFLMGFPKCGSSFLYCVITKVVSSSLFNSTIHTLNVEKEPHFWVLANAAKVKHVPTAEEIGGYLMNFLPGLWKITEKHNGILVDGTPNGIFNWPRFKETEHDLVNYCLLPSVLPKLLPNSKFVVIVRNPLKMLYSAFWFSCTTIGKKFSKESLMKGPDMFHTRIVTKIHKFNGCMTDLSVPSIRHVCEVNNNYSSCIQQRLHLLDKCIHEISYNLFSSELPNCGRSRVAMGIYYAHIRKWLSIVPKKRFIFLTLDELTSNFEQTVQELSEFLDLGTGAFPGHNKLKQILYSCEKNSQSSVDYKHDPRLQMRSDTKQILEQFYHPFNYLLADLLGSERFLWS